MTAFLVHQCPTCERGFDVRDELEQHLSFDHAAPAPPAQVAARVDAAGLVLTFTAVLLVAYAAVFVSASTAVITGAVLLTLVAGYLRRSRSRPRLPRR